MKVKFKRYFAASDDGAGSSETKEKKVDEEKEKDKKPDVKETQDKDSDLKVQLENERKAIEKAEQKLEEQNLANLD